MKDSSRNQSELLEEIALLKREIRDLQNTESRYKALFTGVSQGILAAELDNQQFVYANPALCKMFGYPEEEILRLRVSDIHPENALAQVMADFDAMAQNQKNRAPMIPCLRKDGSLFYADISATSILLDGKPCNVAFFTDVTWRKKLENQMKQSEEQYRLLADNITEHVWLMDIKTLKTTYVSPSIEKIYGYPCDEILNYSLKKLLPPESFQKVKNAFEAEMPKALASPSSVVHKHTLEHEALHRDGHVLWVETTFSILRNEKGNPSLLLGETRDITKRRKAEEALRESEEKYRTILETIEEGYFETDVAGNMTFFNDALCVILHYPREELMGMNYRNFINETELQKVFSVYNEIYKTGHPLSAFVCLITTKDSIPRYIEGSVSLLKDRMGNILGFKGIMRDITSRRQSEEKLHQSEERYRNILENIQEGYYEVDLAGNFTFVNDAECKMLGYSREEMIGMNNRQYMDRENAKSTYRLFSQVYQTGKPVQSAYGEVILKNGKKAYHDISISLIRDKSGNAVGFRGISRDMTERKMAELTIQKQKNELEVVNRQLKHTILVMDETNSRLVAAQNDLFLANKQLRQSEEKFSKAFRLGPFIGTLSSLLDGRFLDVSDHFLKMTEYSREEVIGHTAAELGIWVYMEERNRVIQALENGKAVLDEEIIFQSRSGKPYNMLYSADIITIFDIPHLVSVAIDITERKQAQEEKQKLEERLRQAEKMEAIGQVAGGVAHDLNNVLGVLSGYSELLLMELPEGQKSRSHVEKILQSTAKGAAIIQDLLTLTRRGVASAEVVNLNNIVYEFFKSPVLEDLKITHPRITFHIEYDQSLLNIKGSPVHLEKTLMNLVSNAAESIVDTGTVTIRTENRYLDWTLRGYDEIREGDYAVLTVSDTGTGISEEHREKIFEPFYTRKTMGRSGTGLGLPIVWGTVKDHHGYIDMQTEVNRGTSFTVYFPVSREERVARRKKASVEQYLACGESVLVVDDIAEQREVASGLLKKLGYVVSTVSSGEEAIEYLQSHPVDILVLDMIMTPGIDGMETYRRILEKNPKQKAVLVSGFSETDRVKRAQKLGAGAYICKPYVMEKIGLALRDELKKNR